MSYLFLICLMLFAVQQGASQLNCHQCASKDNLDCLDPYDGDVMEEEYSDSCEDTDTHCLKHKVISRLYDSGFISGKPRETVTITRGCIRAPDEGDGCKYIASDAGFMFQCICSKENCNGAKTQIASFVTMVSGLLFTVLLRRIIL